jgi:hypothetical protein
MKELRSHPLMSYAGFSNWPPIWVGVGGEKDGSAKGEVGILKEVRPFIAPLGNILFLIIAHKKNEYMGCLSFDKSAFCQQVEKLLRQNYNREMSEIGSIQVTDIF